MTALTVLTPARLLTASHGRKISAVQDIIARNLKSQRSNLNLHSVTSSPGKLKSIDDLPGPSLATTTYWLFIKGYADKSHELQVEQKRLYGPIWRSRFGPLDIVNVATPELIAQVLRQDGRYPVRAILPHWKEYRDLRGHAYGLHIETGEQWYRMRSALNPRMLKLQEVAAYTPVINAVVSDMLRRLERLRLRSQDKATVCDLVSELYMFGFEGVSAILFEARLGCLEDEVPPETVRFIAAVAKMLTLSETVLLIPRWMRNVLPYWAQFVQAWDDLSDVVQNLVDRKVKQMEEQVQHGEKLEGMYLTYLLSSGKLSLPELYITTTELLLGAVDTTSNTMSWTLYHLAREPEMQDRLYREVVSVCPDRNPPTTEDLSRMPYLKAVIKETLRMYPVVPGNGRFNLENEIVVDGYLFPKETQFHLCHYAASHDENEFPDSKRFMPERWLRGEPTCSKHHPYSSIPFGVGVRACVGRRVAELEMYIGLSRILQHYEVRPADGAPTILPKTRTLLIPSKPINLHFIPRA